LSISFLVKCLFRPGFRFQERRFPENSPDRCLSAIPANQTIPSTSRSSSSSISCVVRSLVDHINTVEAIPRALASHWSTRTLSSRAAVNAATAHLSPPNAIPLPRIFPNTADRTTGSAPKGGRPNRGPVADWRSRDLCTLCHST
jgi:hypothetical protein